MRRTAVVSALALLLVLSGCSANGSGQSAESGGSAPSLIEPAPADQAAEGDATARDRDVITTGQVDVVADDPARAADEAVDLVSAAGGRIDASSRTPANEFQNATASLTARIPADRLTETIEAISSLGEVRTLSTQASDVTSQTTDLDARIESLTAAVDRLRQLLSAAESTADLIAVEEALSSREAELESLTAQRAYLADQVDYSTLSVTFSTPEDAPASGPEDFWSAVMAGFGALVASLGALVIAVGAALPWLIFLALVALLVVGVVRLVRRSRARRRAAAPHAGGPDAPAGPTAGPTAGTDAP